MKYDSHAPSVINNPTARGLISLKAGLGNACSCTLWDTNEPGMINRHTTHGLIRLACRPNDTHDSILINQPGKPRG